MTRARRMGIALAAAGALATGAAATSPASAASADGQPAAFGAKSHCSGKAAQRLGGHSFWGGCTSWR